MADKDFETILTESLQKYTTSIEPNDPGYATIMRLGKFKKRERTMKLIIITLIGFIIYREMVRK